MQGRYVVGGGSSTACPGWAKAILFIQYLYLNDSRPEARKRQKKCVDLCEVEPKQGAIEEFFDLVFAAAVKT